MAAQVFNFLWLNLDLPAPPDPADGSIRVPLPFKYIRNVRKAAQKNPGTDVVLWVDSQRLTERQLGYLHRMVEEKLPNARVQDLRGIAAYDSEELYNRPQEGVRWRDGGQTSTIWLQVDAAKILISLQGDYEQAFFADLDHAHLEINSDKVQGMMNSCGLMIGSVSTKYAEIENQLWGFNRSRRDFFELYYQATSERGVPGLQWLERAAAPAVERDHGPGKT